MDYLPREVAKIVFKVIASLKVSLEERKVTTMPASLAQVASDELRRRVKMETLFGPSLFADPSRDILLDLFVQDAKGRSVPISEACIASRVPATTALRYIAALESVGLLQRVRDGVDKRRILLKLTSTARNRMVEYLENRPPFAGEAVLGERWRPPPISER